MRYWVYINDKVDGPYDADQLTVLPGFTPDTLICAETTEEGGKQEWVKASSVFEFEDETETAPQAEGEDALKTIHLEETPTELTAVTPEENVEAEQSTTLLLIDKIDRLTREIEGLKSKVDQAVAASAAAQEAAKEAAQAATQAASAPHPQDAPVSSVSSVSKEEEPVVEEALITNTESLVNHAEQLVAQASSAETKPADFLNEIKIDAEKTENLEDNKAGEEVVLRSALDSLYNAQTLKEQTEAEKESTFQDLLSPATKAILAASTAAAAGAAIVNTQQEQKTQAPAPITEEQREDIINEITAQAPQEDVIAQAIEEAQAVQSAPAEIPVIDSLPEVQPIAEPASIPPTTEKSIIDDIAAHPQLTINSINQEEVKETPKVQAPVTAEVQPSVVPDDMQLTPMNPEETKEEVQEKEQESIKELVPGKELEAAPQDGILSQADLDEAFLERPAVAEEANFPTEEQAQPEVAEALPQAAEVPAQAEEKALEQKEPVSDANDMTEVELKEGSTYLISDFIPPAQTSQEEAAKQQKPTEVNSFVQVPTMATMSESIEEIVPENKANDLEMSKVILENTIKMKRGASMDIKTVPMVHEPSDTERLDLTNSELDINAQHDLKEADFQSSGSKLTKVILGLLVAIVFFVLIYVMLAYLNILPPSMNFMKKTASAQQMQNTANINDMLPEVSQPNGNMQNAPLPLPAGVENQLNPQQTDLGEEPVDPKAAILTEVRNYPMVNGQTLQQLINSRHPAQQNLIEWNITTAVEPDNYSIIVKVPPENPQSFKISYRFNYNTVTKALDPTISDSKNLLDSLRRPAAY